jgi:hypothetical protein
MILSDNVQKDYLITIHMPRGFSCEVEIKVGHLLAPSNIGFWFYIKFTQLLHFISEPEHYQTPLEVLKIVYNYFHSRYTQIYLNSFPNKNTNFDIFCAKTEKRKFSQLFAAMLMCV